MSLGNAFRVSRVPMLMLGAVGVFWGALSGLMPELKEGIGASDGTIGLVLLAPALGSVLAMALAPGMIRLLGGRLVPAALGTMCLVFFLPPLAGQSLTLALVLGVAGWVVAFNDITANVLISQREARHGQHLMNANHAMFSLAFGLSALAVGYARKLGWEAREIMPALALVILAFLLMAREPAQGQTAPDGNGANGTSAMPWAAVWLSALILFASFIGENATEAWSALHIERTLGAPPGEGAFGPAMLGLSMTLFRLIGQVLATRLGEARLVVISAMAGTAGALIIALATAKGVVLIGAAIMGLGMAVIVPSVNTMLGRRVEERQRAHALSRAWMLGMAGFFVGPAMMGGLAELWSLRVSFAWIAVMVALIVPATLALARR